MNYVYILQCSDDSLYTGYTTDVLRRLSEHQSGKAAKYTRGRGPFQLVYVEPCLSRPEALRREIQIKSFTRRQKHQLIDSQCIWKVFPLE